MEIEEFETSVIKIIPRTHDIKSFRFAVPDDINFKPGQYSLVTIRIKGQDATKTFSLSNSPTERGYVEFTKRITQSDFSQALNQLKIGGWGRLKMPFGSFTFEGEFDKVAFVAGGVGITATRSMCKNACDRKLSTDITLVYANRTEKDIAFHDDFDGMQAENSSLEIVYTVDEPIDRAAWKGRIGFINSGMVKQEIPDYSTRIFYVCGPPRMVDSMRFLLSNELKLDEQQIKWERFSGYD